MNGIESFGKVGHCVVIGVAVLNIKSFPWVTSYREEKGGEPGRCRSMAIICKFGEGKELGPITLFIISKKPHIRFNLLIHMLGLAIGLRVIGSRWVFLYMQDLVKFPHES